MDIQIRYCKKKNNKKTFVKWYMYMVRAFIYLMVFNDFSDNFNVFIFKTYMQMCLLDDISTIHSDLSKIRPSFVV